MQSLSKMPKGDAKPTRRFPLAEVFGFDPADTTSEARTHRNGRLCRFHNVVASCTKNSKSDPLGVCSIAEGEGTAIVCPVRFREDWKILGDAADLVFGEHAEFLSLQEVRLKEKSGKSAGNLDYVLARLDQNNKIVDFAGIEVQGVYISGNVTKPFRHFMQQHDDALQWRGQVPSADYLSSSRKRLAPQLLFKGGILNHWGKKSVVVIDAGFFSTLPKFATCEPENANLYFLIYALQKAANGKYVLTKTQTVFADFRTALTALTTPVPGDVAVFVATLQKLADKRRSSQNTLPIEPIKGDAFDDEEGNDEVDAD